MKSKTLSRIRAQATRWVVGVALLLAAGIPAAYAETLMMPDRDARMNTSLVVWGVTTQANGTAYSMDFGDGSLAVVGVVGDRSYIAFNHTYTTENIFTATLTVGVEVATTEVTAFDVSLLPGGATGDANRSLGINMAIEDGLRHLWTSQAGRAANFPANVSTNWGNSYPYADASLIVLAFENHGYSLANDGSAPTGLYEKYIVRRGLNYVMSQLSSLNIGATPQGDDPCVGVADAPAPCSGLQAPGFPGYSTAVAILPFAASGALARVNTEVGGATAGMTFGEVLQRLVNTQAWGAADGAGSIHRGGFRYSFNSGSFDGSTAGWAILGFLDAAAAGAIVPAWVATEFEFGFDNNLNNDGSFDYVADGNSALNSSPGPAKVGIGLQGLFLIGELAGARVNAVTTNINSWWPGAVPYGIGGNSWGGDNNHGGGYVMFNMFKGLKLHGIATLPDVDRSTHAWAFLGTGAEDDWYADYQDWLIANQSASGSWGPSMSFSCCYSGDPLETAMAELVLSAVALVLPDPIKFATIGLTPFTDTNFFGESHTVNAHAEGFCTPVPPATTCIGPPVPGATVDFAVLSGPNTGAAGSGSAVTDASGNAVFTYTDAAGVAGTDTIQASIGSLNSNIVEKHWISPNSPPDVSGAVPSVACTSAPGKSMISIDILGLTDPDGDALIVLITGITSDERTKKNGGDPAPDGSGVGTSTASVRDQRFGSGDGRVYEISFTADDGTAAPVAGSVFVAVPHDNAPPADPCSDAVNSGQIYDATQIN